MKTVIWILMIACIALTGCTETEKQPIYGQGNPPAEYQALFGNTNGARLDYMQNRILDQLSKRIARLEDPNEVAN